MVLRGYGRRSNGVSGRSKWCGGWTLRKRGRQGLRRTRNQRGRDGHDDNEHKHFSTEEDGGIAGKTVCGVGGCGTVRGGILLVANGYVDGDDHRRLVCGNAAAAAGDGVVAGADAGSDADWELEAGCGAWSGCAGVDGDCSVGDGPPLAGLSADHSAVAGARGDASAAAGKCGDADGGERVAAGLGAGAVLRDDGAQSFAAAGRRCFWHGDGDVSDVL